MPYSPQSNKSASRTGGLSSVTRGVRRLNLLCVNAYILEATGGQHVLVDTGLSIAATHLQGLLPARPYAIVLTHGHCDHAGSAEASRAFGIPVFAHPLELPYLSGRAAYTLENLSAGGPAALFSRFFRNRSLNLGSSLRPLPADGTIPLLPDWCWRTRRVIRQVIFLCSANRIGR